MLNYFGFQYESIVLIIVLFIISFQIAHIIVISIKIYVDFIR